MAELNPQIPLMYNYGPSPIQQMQQIMSLKDLMQQSQIHGQQMAAQQAQAEQIRQQAAQRQAAQATFQGMGTQPPIDYSTAAIKPITPITAPAAAPVPPTTGFAGMPGFTAAPATDVTMAPPAPQIPQIQVPAQQGVTQTAPTQQAMDRYTQVKQAAQGVPEEYSFMSPDQYDTFLKMGQASPQSGMEYMKEILGQKQAIAMSKWYGQRGEFQAERAESAESLARGALLSGMNLDFSTPETAQASIDHIKQMEPVLRAHYISDQDIQTMEADPTGKVYNDFVNQYKNQMTSKSKPGENKPPEYLPNGDLKLDDKSEKSWTQPLEKVSGLIASSRTPLGAIYKLQYGLNRAIGILNQRDKNGNLLPVNQQDIANIQNDVSAGGKEAAAAGYGNTLFGQFSQFLQQLAGTPQKALTDPLRQQWIARINEMQGQNKQVIGQSVGLAKNLLANQLPIKLNSYLDWAATQMNVKDRKTFTPSMVFDPDEYQSIVDARTAKGMKSIGYTDPITNMYGKGTAAPAPAAPAEETTTPTIIPAAAPATRQPAIKPTSKTPAPAPLPMPKVGDIVKGYKYKGGDPKNPSSWEIQ